MAIELVTIARDELVTLLSETVRAELERITPNDRRPMSQRQIADDQNVSPSTIRRWMKEGMPFLKGGRPGFRKRDVEEWRLRKSEYV